MSIVNFKPYLNQKIRQKNCNQKYFKLKILSKEKEVNEMRDRLKNFNLSTFLIFIPVPYCRLVRRVSLYRLHDYLIILDPGGGFGDNLACFLVLEVEFRLHEPCVLWIFKASRGA